MSNEVILITGANGFIGRPLVQQARRTYQVLALDRTPPPDDPRGAPEYIQCDLDSTVDVFAACAEIARRGVTTIASVVHLAANLEINEGTDPAASLEATRRILRALRCFHVEQVVFASTMTVHAPGKPGRRINENSRLDPKWNFPREKLTIENLLLIERAGIPVVNLRLAGVYDDHCHSIPLAQQIDRIREKRITSRHFAGNLQHGQAYLHLDDLIAAVLRVVERRHSLPAEVSLLLGEPDTPSYDSLQRKIGWLLHAREWKTHRVSKHLARTALWLQYGIAEVDPFLRPWMLDIADHHYELDISRAHELLDWRPQHSLLETLPRMIEHLRTDPAGWERDHRLIA